MIIIATILCACDNALIKKNEKQQEHIFTENHIDVFVDRKTGVEYIIYDKGYTHMITPRYNADGALSTQKVK